MKKGMEELRPDWQVGQSIQSRAQFFNRLQELKQYQQQQQVPSIYPSI